MILVYINKIESASTLLTSAFQLANSLEKSFCVLYLVDNDSEIAVGTTAIESVLDALKLKDSVKLIVQCGSIDDVHKVCETHEASFLFIQQLAYNRKSIQQSLTACRDLRIPYLIFKDSFAALDLKTVIMPIGFLEEELEKAQFAAAFGRFCGSEVVMLLANDYGSKAITNARKMKTLFEKFSFNYRLEKGKADSFGIDKEGIALATELKSGVVIVTASREYGLDDVIFGPKELHLVKKYDVPVLLINPRADLYALCD